jgi:outer membrane protein assembly factor BamB
MLSAAIMIVALLAATGAGASYTAGDICTDDTAIQATTSFGAPLAGIWARDGGTPAYVTTALGIYQRDSATLQAIDSYSYTATGPPVPALLWDGDLGIVTNQDSGRISRYDPIGDAEVWARTLQNGNPNDALSRRPVVQLRSEASDAFRAAHATDLIVAATRQSGDLTDNRVYALNAETGQTVWIFNENGAVDMDNAFGMALDPPIDTVYVTTARTSASQDSVWAIDVTTGAGLWSANCGQIWTEPVLDGDRVYVVSLYGVIHALDAADGSELWSRSLGVPVTADAKGVQYSGAFHLVVADALGNVFLIRDEGGSSAEAWSTAVVPNPQQAVTLPIAIGAELGRVYTADDVGNLVYLDLATGAIEATVPIDDSAVEHIELMTETDGQTTVVVASADGDVAKLCTIAPAAVPVPSLGPWGGAVLALALAGAGGLAALPKRSEGGG